MSDAFLIDPATVATMSDDELARTLSIDVSRIGDVLDTVAHNPTSTIEPAHHASADVGGRRALEGLDARREERGITAGLDIERTIGEGGMGSLLACFAATVDARLWGPVFVFYGAFLVACASPARVWDMMSLANFVLLAAFVIAWWSPREDRPRFMAAHGRARERAPTTRRE